MPYERLWELTADLSVEIFGHDPRINSTWRGGYICEGGNSQETPEGGYQGRYRRRGRTKAPGCWWLSTWNRARVVGGREQGAETSRSETAGIGGRGQHGRVLIPRDTLFLSGSNVIKTEATAQLMTNNLGRFWVAFRWVFGWVGDPLKRVLGWVGFRQKWAGEFEPSKCLTPPDPGNWAPTRPPILEKHPQGSHASIQLIYGWDAQPW